MNRDLKGNWQHLKCELRHRGTDQIKDLDWIDSSHDYTRGRVAPQRAPRMRVSHTAIGRTAPRSR